MATRTVNWTFDDVCGFEVELEISVSNLAGEYIEDWHIDAVLDEHGNESPITEEIKVEVQKRIAKDEQAIIDCAIADARAAEEAARER